MSTAAEQLPPAYAGAEVGRVPEWAAKEILARVYLNTAGCPLEQAGTLDQARPLLEEIIAQEAGDVHFVEDYAELFGETTSTTSSRSRSSPAVSVPAAPSR